MYGETIQYLVLLVFELYRRVLYIPFQHFSSSFKVKTLRATHVVVWV